MLGFGTVGSAVARLLYGTRAPLRLTHIFNRAVERKKSIGFPRTCAGANIEEILASDADVMVELSEG